MSILDSLKEMHAILVSACSHPRDQILGQYPKSVGGKQICLCCRKVRKQKWHGGPWTEWKVESK